MLKIQMLTNKDIFCIYRRYLCLLALLCLSLNQVLKAQIYITDSTSLKIENGALLCVAKAEINIKKENAKIYVLEGAIVKNLSEESNADIIYVEKVHRTLHNYAKRRNEKPEHKKQETVSLDNNVKLHFTSQSVNDIFKFFEGNNFQLTIPNQNLPIAKAILNEISSLIDAELFYRELFLFSEDLLYISFNSDFSIRPPPFYISFSDF